MMGFSIRRIRKGSNPISADMQHLPFTKSWKNAPFVAALFCLGFLILQLRHPSDPSEIPGPVKLDGVDPGSLELQMLEKTLDVSHVVDTSFRSDGYSNASDFSQNVENPGVHVFVCTDEMDIRPLLVVINSTIINARNPERIWFHIVTPEPKHAELMMKLRRWFPNINMEMVRDDCDVQHIKKHISFRKDSKAREELATPYNFIPFYLPHLFQSMEKLIYLDSDVVVKAAIEDIYDVDLEGHAVAVVEDCSQKFHMYFNFNLLHKIEEAQWSWLPNEGFDPDACVFNRGVLVIDVKKWLQENLTETIEWWLDEFSSADLPLYKYGVSQPPFLLALYKKYLKLDMLWNVRGLGRKEFSEAEREYISKLYGKRPGKRPFLSPEADQAKILHFNGRYKPWKRGRTLQKGEQPASLCGAKTEDCANLWWSYLSPFADVPSQ